MTGLLLATAHHIVVFTMAAILIVQIALVRPGISAEQVVRLRRLDGIFGSLIALVLIVGFLQISYGTKGRDFYTDNPVFWAKMAAFAAVGLISVQPSIRIYLWWQQARGGSFFSAPSDELARIRIFLRVEAAVFFATIVIAIVAARSPGISF